MKFLYILRHAKASKGDPTLSDHKRPLNDIGVTQAPLMGKLIRREKITPDIIISSDARRALETAKLVASSCGYMKPIEEDPKFYQANLDNVMRRLQKLIPSVQRVMVVGHNPEWEELVYKLSGQSLELSTAALVEVAFAIKDWDEIAKAKGKLIRHWSPKDQ